MEIHKVNIYFQYQDDVSNIDDVVEKVVPEYSLHYYAEEINKDGNRQTLLFVEVDFEPKIESEAAINRLEVIKQKARLNHLDFIRAVLFE